MEWNVDKHRGDGQDMKTYMMDITELGHPKMVESAFGAYYLKAEVDSALDVIAKSIDAVVVHNQKVLGKIGGGK
jgi:hypothetical protein